jgi:Zn-dependent peptidase ImmA (M78 family)
VNYTQLIQELETVAGQLGVSLRYEKGDFEGGFCVLREQKLLVVNKRLPDARKASSVAVGLAHYGIDETFVKPTLRQYIEDEAAKMLKPR